MKRVKTYHNVKFCKYETFNAAEEISEEFQYKEFDEFEKTEIVEINLSETSATSSHESIRIKDLTAQPQNTSELINQNIETAEPHIKPQEIRDSHRVSHDISHEVFCEISHKPMNMNIASCCSDCNQQSTRCHKNEFYYDSDQEIASLQHVTFISAVTMSIDNDLNIFHEIMIHED